jgi:two-component system sensor histidine kinase KdpD
MQSGSLSVRKEICPLEEPIMSATSRLRRLLQGRDVRVDLPGAMLLVPVDPVLIEQVFINLLENAARFSPEGAPIELRAWVEDGRAVVTVADRGPGIPAGEEGRIFERFYRAADGMRAGGTGLGLAICFAIVRAHGGRIEVMNREGGGAVFRFTLPLENARAAAGSDRTATSHAPDHGAAEGVEPKTRSEA